MEVMYVHPGFLLLKLHKAGLPGAQVMLGRKRSRGTAATLLTFRPVNRALQDVHQVPLLHQNPIL